MIRGSGVEYPKVNYSKLSTIEELDYFAEALATVEDCEWTAALLQTFADNDNIVTIKEQLNTIIYLIC